MHKHQAIKYKQNKQDFVSCVLPLKLINKTSKVLIYDIDEDGYQREPIPSHFNGIKRFVLDKINEFVLPTSIILGIDKSDLSKILIKDKDLFFISFENIDSKIFRIVDGQHRIKGLAIAALEDENINNFLLNCIILVTEPGSRSKELAVFTDINSKARRINTDLAELAKHDYEIKEQNISKKNIPKHIAIKTAYKLKENRKESVLYKSIKFDIHSSQKLGIIGVKTFTDSILDLIKIFLSIHPPLDNRGNLLQGQELIEFTDSLSDKVSELLFKAWDESVKSKWKYSFIKTSILDEDGKPLNIYYNRKNYILKALGFKAIHKILIQSISSSNNNIEKGLLEFNKIIKNSLIQNKHWEAGNVFSGYNSESGFKKIKEIIENKRPIPIL